jgi:hypothetical protein
MIRTRFVEQGMSVLASGEASLQAIKAGREDAVSLLERYVELLSIWQSHFGEPVGAQRAEDVEPLHNVGPEHSGSDNRSAPQPDKRSHEEVVLLQSVADLHDQILRMVDEAKGGIADALRTLHERGRGVRAYTEQFPRRVSTLRPRKG